MADSLLTDEIRAWIGREFPPVTGEVTARDIERFAIAVDDLNPLYLDPEQAAASRHGGIIAPPMFYEIPVTRPTPLGRLRPDGLGGSREMPSLPLKRIMAGGVDCEFHTPMRPGDTITARRKLAEIVEREGRSGPMIFLTWETRFTNQRDELCAVVRTTAIAR